MLFTMTPRRHELMSVYLLGAGTLFLYLGYVTQSFISESVIHTVYINDNTRINPHAGYYGQAFHYSAFAVSSILTPSIQHYVGSKWILTAASAFFAVYYLGFFHITNFYFYFSQILMGVGYSLYNNGEGAYLSEHSSRRTIESNTGIETAVGHSSMFVGGLALMAIFYFTGSSPVASSMVSNIVNGTAKPSAAISLSEEQIQVVYSVLFLLNVVSVLIFAILPTKQHDSLASKTTNVLPSFNTQLKRLAQTVISPNMLLLIPFFLYMGLIVSFLMAIYPTTLAFTSGLSSDIYAVAIYSTGMGVSEIFGGVFLRPMIKRLKQWGLVFTMSMHFLCAVGTITVATLSVPETATIAPTTAGTLLISPSRYSVIAVALLIGLGDFSITMARAVICQVAVPESRMEVFSISRLWQCVASCIVLILSPKMTLYHWSAALSVTLLLGTLSFIVVALRTNKTSRIASTERLQDKEEESVESV